MIVNTVKAFPCLQSIILSELYDAGGPHLFALNIFKSCHPRLKHVYIEDEIDQEMYNRYSLTPDRSVVSTRIRIEGHWMEEGVIESPEGWNFS